MSSDDHSSNGNKYSQVPPPSEFSSSGAAPKVDFSDALQKARAIAEKLKQAGGNATPPVESPSTGSKRSHYDDDDDQSSYHSSKRATYDTSQPSYMRNEPRRYGLGSEERQRQRHDYGEKSSIKVPSRMVGIIIGRGGDNLKKAERYSGARIQIDQDDGDNERNITLIGEQDQIQLARDMIQQMVRDATDENDIRLKLTVPASKVGLVIGRGGDTIRDLEEKSGAKIKVLPDTGDRSAPRTVSIMGDQRATEKAKALVEDIINGEQGYHNEQRHHDATDTVRIPKEFVGLIIGRGGETVRALQEESGARIVVDKYGDPHGDHKTLTIHGTPETIAIAKDLITEKVESGQNARGGYGSGRGGRGGYRGGRGGGSHRNDYYGANDEYQQPQETAYDYSQYQNYYGQSYNNNEYEQYNPQQANDGYNYPAAGDDKKDKTSGDYYGQYYDSSGQDQQQWTQEAYNQYYQQYYEGYQPENYEQPKEDDANAK